MKYFVTSFSLFLSGCGAGAILGVVEALALPLATLAGVLLVGVAFLSLSASLSISLHSFVRSERLGSTIGEKS